MKGAACGGLSRVWRRECRKSCLWRRIQLWRSVIYNAETFNIVIHPTHSLALLRISLSLSPSHIQMLLLCSPQSLEFLFFAGAHWETHVSQTTPVHSERTLINQTEKNYHAFICSNRTHSEHIKWVQIHYKILKNVAKTDWKSLH